MNVFTLDNPWASLEELHTSEGIVLRGCAGDGPHSVYLGVDAYGQYLFLLKLPEGEEHVDSCSLPKISGCHSSFINIENDTYFELLLLELKNWRLFKFLIQEIVTVLEEERKHENARLLKLLIETLKRCSVFFSKKRESFTRESALGLYGELYFMLNMAAGCVGWLKAIQTWRGPLGYPQDYVIGSSAVEVKATETGHRRTVRISSIDQLNPTCANGYLYVVFLSEAVSGQGYSLCDLVDKIYSELESASLNAYDFDLKLSLYGYSASSKYALQEYAVTESSFYHLTNDFPRITPDAVCLGIENVRYFLNLNYCSSFITNPTTL